MSKNIKIFAVTLVVFSMSYIALVLYLSKSGTIAITHLGAFGDSFGPLTSIFTALAFGGLVWSLSLQRAANTLHKEELATQVREVQETRDQALTTRLMSLTLQQSSELKSEVAGLQFCVPLFGLDMANTKNVNLPEFLERMRHMISNDQLIMLTEVASQDEALARSARLRGYKEVLELNRERIREVLCTVERHCFQNEKLIELSPVGAAISQDIKDLFFAGFPVDLLDFIKDFNTVFSVLSPRGINQERENNGSRSTWKSALTSANAIESWHDKVFIMS